MSLGEIAFYNPPEEGPHVITALTAPAYSMARSEAVLSVVPNLLAMRTIAERVGYLDSSGNLPSLVVVARNANKFPYWDGHLQNHVGDPDVGMFFSAERIGEEHPPTADRWRLVGMAREIGASTLTE